MGSETHVGRLLREAREGRFKGRSTGLRQIEEALGISRPTLNHWETGHTKTIPVAQVFALVEYLDVPLEELRVAALADASALRDAQRGAGEPDRPRSAEEIAASADVLVGDEHRREAKSARARRGKPAP